MQTPGFRLIWGGILIVACGGLCAQSQQVKFDKLDLTDKFFCEGATFGDLDGDGDGDLISGPYWYEGPSFRERHEIYAARAFDTGRYSDNFFAYTHDFDGDGRLDVLVIGFPGKDASWFRNPGKKHGHWKRHKVFDVVDNESPTFQNLVGDGKPELVCQTAGRIGWAAPDWKHPASPWKFHPLSTPGIGGMFTHGLGVGDVNGDGRNDVLWKKGWWEQPESLKDDPVWKHHAWPFADRGGAQMYAFDVDGDGDNDVVSADNAHGYGLFWFEHQKADGAIVFKKHRIMGERPEQEPHGIAIGNLHAMDVADVNGDGLPDLITGNRYYAHGGRDRADKEPPAIAWLQLVRTPKGARFVPHVIDMQSGVGTQVVAGDVTGDGLIDIVVGNKAGTFLHRQKRVTAKSTGQDEEDKDLPLDEAPTNRDGARLNLGFEDGDLRDWRATGKAFDGLPVQGDVVHDRRRDSLSNHEGTWWVGTYEPRASDKTRGTLTSVRFKVNRPWASFLVGGGQWKETRVEIVLADKHAVIHKAHGRNRENMHHEIVDLRPYQGKQIYIRLVDDHAGGWGHINFDHFRFHAKRPERRLTGKVETSTDQKIGLSAEAAAGTMTVPGGFKVDVIAAEPDLHQPIAFTIDHKGRLWVAEAHSYPVRRKDSDAKDMILVFEDADGDGTFEKRSVFAENLNLVSGLEVGFGGVWVGAAPWLLFIPDADGDLRPDGPPQKLLDGWGFQDTHETLNSFIWGPDGWLYGCHGVFTHSRVGKPGTPDKDRAPINAGIWRYHPTKHRFEVFAWGTSNPWGVDFDANGQAFATACVIPHIYHMVQGGRFLRQAGQHFSQWIFDDIDTIADHRHYLGSTPHSGNGVSGSVGGGHAHCGLMIYQGDAFPEHYRGMAFMNNVHGNRVNMDILEREGTGFVASHGEDFLLANDRWFRGINLKYGPDGSVFFIDWYDKEACHLRKPEVWDRSNGRLYRVAYGNSRQGPRDLAAMSSKELATLHLNENEWYVRMARRVLQERGASQEARRELLATLKRSTNPRDRLRLLWTLHAGGMLSDREIIVQLGSEHEYVRAWAVQLLLEDREASLRVVKKLEIMADSDSSPVVRLYLASALQRLPFEQRWGIARGLLSREEDESDHNQPLMIWYGIEPLVPADPGRAATLARDSKLDLPRRFIYRRLSAGTKPLLAAALRGLGRANDDDTRDVILQEMHAALSRRGKVTMPAGWTGLSRTLLASKHVGVREHALRLAALFGDSDSLQELRETLARTSAPTARRREALLDLLGARDAGLVAILHELVGDVGLRLDAIRALAAFDDERTPKILLAGYAAWGAAAREEATRTLVSRAAWAQILLSAVIDGDISKDVLNLATTRRSITHLREEKLDVLMVKAWGRTQPTSRGKEGEIKRWIGQLDQSVLAQADRENGRAVFARTCMKCHMLFGIGREVGPDLTGSNRADLDYLFRNMIDPSGEVAKEYVVTRLETEDGRSISGIATEENEHAVTIKTETDTVTVARSEIAVDGDGEKIIWKSTASMMPEGQLEGMKTEDVRDLVAYLGSPRQVPMKAEAENLHLFFNGSDLVGWDANPEVWSVEDGEIVGRTREGLQKNDFARSHLLVGDFRLTLEVKLVGDRGNSGIQIRSAEQRGGSMAGYQADIGPGWWGKLYEEHGRGILWKKPGDVHVKKGAWNSYEILALGHRIRTAINGHPCVDLQDPGGALRGLIGLQLHSGGPTEVRFRNLKLELDTK